MELDEVILDRGASNKQPLGGGKANQMARLVNICVARLDLVPLVEKDVLPTVARSGVEKRRASEEAVSRYEDVVRRGRSLVRRYDGRAPRGRRGEDLAHDH